MIAGANRWFLPLLVSVYLVGCGREETEVPEGPLFDPSAHPDHLFTLLPSRFTGVRFANRVTDTRDGNVFTYRNYYNGGGVAIGDLTGDGLPEVFLTANLETNRLYLNEGGFHFRDVTDVAGVGGNGAWTTGVTFADVNGDGLLDIYVCYAGNVAGERRANELYIHQGLDRDGVPRFKEMAAEYGIADEGYSTHAAFFDYDRDGYLDLYLVNNSFRPVSSFGLRNIRHVRDELGGDKLFHNVGGHFVDVSEAAGIYGSEFAFGLGVAVGDVNRDGWPDIYVSNDFFERDYLYINNGNGTFTESLERQMPSISYSSMGLDMADVDNDGLLDIFVTDMLPADDYRLKTTSTFEDWNGYQAKLKNDYHHQFMRNTLQRNNGNGTFSEIGELAGVARTDWSWSALLQDFDLDGYKDVHVTNGVLHDVTSQDYVSYLASEETIVKAARGKHVDFLGLIAEMPSTPLPNYVFRNDRNGRFSNVGADWGLNTMGFSNGAAYGDLDGDGALDLVVNNVNQEASVYRNNARILSHNNYVQIVLNGEGSNRFGVGAKVTIQSGGQQFYQEEMPSRGFQSSVDYALTFGIGQLESVDSITVDWPDGRRSVLLDVLANQRLVIQQTGAKIGAVDAPPVILPLLEDVTDDVALTFVHHENAFDDFDREPLMPRLLSTQGPFMTAGDVNGDGRADMFIGGAKDQPGRLLVAKTNGGYESTNEEVFDRDRISEDLGVVLFDATGDGHPDLYVVSGGSEFSDMAPALQDRLYLNDGRGTFRKSNGYLPVMNISGSRAAPADYDGDGDLDLFVGGRVVPWRYGLNPQSVLLQNDGRGHFRDVTSEVAPALTHVGMVTDALWTDVDQDGRVDLVVVGEWMPITILRNTGGGRLEPIHAAGLERSNGWWNRIVAGDFTGDGRTDFVVGNFGLNSRLRAADDEPTTMYVDDFGRTGFVEQIISCYENGVSHPLTLRDDLLRSLPALRARYPTFESYARETVADIIGSVAMADLEPKKVYTFSTSLVVNNGDASFTLSPLPLEAQLAPVFGILATDVDRDGMLDLLLAGNFDGVKPEIGRMSAGYGLLMRGDGKGFEPVPTAESGFFVPGQARDIQRVESGAGPLYVVTRNNERPLVFRSAPGGVVSARRALRRPLASS